MEDQVHRQGLDGHRVRRPERAELIPGRPKRGKAAAPVAVITVERPEVAELALREPQVAATGDGLDRERRHVRRAELLQQPRHALAIGSKPHDARTRALPEQGPRDVRTQPPNPHETADADRVEATGRGGWR